MMLSVEDYKVYYYTSDGAVKAVDGVSLKVKKGHSIGVIGESGCGKSTLAFGMLNLIPRPGKIAGGKIFLDNIDLLSLSPEEFRKDIRWKRISMVFQGAMNALNPVYKVGYQLLEPFLDHLGTEGDEEKVAKSLELVGLDREVMNRYPHELSGGMKQRAVIAMALILNPSLVIADEPTTALDVIVQAQIMNLFKKLKRALDISFIFITHDLSIEAEVAEDIYVMYAGKIVEKGSNFEIYKNPKHPYTQMLLAATPRLHEEKKLEFIPGIPPDLISPPEGCRFHPRCPHAMSICKQKEPRLIEIEGNHWAACHLLR